MSLLWSVAGLQVASDHVVRVALMLGVVSEEDLRNTLPGQEVPMAAGTGDM